MGRAIDSHFGGVFQEVMEHLEIPPASCAVEDSIGFGLSGLLGDAYTSVVCLDLCEVSLNEDASRLLKAILFKIIIYLKGSSFFETK